MSAQRPSGEDGLIERYFKPIATAAGALGLTDDAAVLGTDGAELVVTTDAIVAGVHFLPDDPPESIARKALRVNLSDLAAKGADPAGFVLTLALRQADDSWLAPFARALGEDAAAFRCPLLGGDTVSTPGPLMISITAFGRVPPGQMVRRSAACVGDVLAVTGTIGDAALGLRVLRSRPAALGSEDAAALIARYRVPQPRTALAPALRVHARAAMDVSDGLVGDLAKLCAASGVSADIDAGLVPLSAAARHALASGVAAFPDCVTGGDDYEILCAIAPDHVEKLRHVAEVVRIPLTVFGTVVAGCAPPRWRDAAGQSLTFARPSFSHF